MAPEHTLQERVESLVTACRKILSESSPQSVRAVFLYGSSLGPGFRPDSDVDIAILDDTETPLSWHEQARLMDLLERKLRRSVDLRMLRDGSLPYQAHVLKQGELVWARSTGDLESYRQKALSAFRIERERSEEEWPRVLQRLAGRSTPAIR